MLRFDGVGESRVICAKFQFQRTLPHCEALLEHGELGPLLGIQIQLVVQDVVKLGPGRAAQGKKCATEKYAGYRGGERYQRYKNQAAVMRQGASASRVEGASGVDGPNGESSGAARTALAAMPVLAIPNDAAKIAAAATNEPDNAKTLRASLARRARTAASRTDSPGWAGSAASLCNARSRSKFITALPCPPKVLRAITPKPSSPLAASYSHIAFCKLVEGGISYSGAYLN